MLGVLHDGFSPAATRLGLGRALGLGAVSLVLLVAFVVREGEPQPDDAAADLPLAKRLGANLIQALSVAGMSGMFFLGPLYLQRVLGYDALEIGLAFLPVTIVVGTLSITTRSR